MTTIQTVEELERLYGKPLETSTVKEVPYVTEHYRRFIELSPFVLLATAGPEGLDCSPRGDLAEYDRAWPERARKTLW